MIAESYRVFSCYVKVDGMHQDDRCQEEFFEARRRFTAQKRFYSPPIGSLVLLSVTLRSRESSLTPRVAFITISQMQSVGGINAELRHIFSGFTLRSS